MTLDLACLGIVIVFAVLGFFSGFAMQLLRLIVLVAAYMLAILAGKPMGAWLAGAFNIPLLLGRVMGTAVAFLIIYSVLSTVGWSLLKRRRKRKAKLEAKQEGKPVRASWDPWLGALFGGAKAGFIVFILLNALVLMGGKVEPALKRAGVEFDKSVAANLAKEHNLLASMHLPVVGDLNTLQKLADDPQYRQKAMNDPAIQKLARHPKIRGLLGDRSIIQASKTRDVASLMGNPKINALMEDPEIQKLLGQIDLSKIK